MIVLGLVLIVLATAVLLAAIFGGGNQPASLDLGALDVDTTTLGVFLLGCGTLLVFVAGLELVRTGARRGYARRQEVKQARKVVKEQERRDGHHRHDGHAPPQEAAERDPAESTTHTPEHRDNT